MELVDYIKQLYNIRKKQFNDDDDREYICREDFILRHGQHFISQPLPAILSHHRGKKKECFKNAFDFANYYGFIYVEGYALSILPLDHAWCTDEEGKVYEVTWDEPGTEYFGVCFNTKYVLETILDSGRYGIFNERRLPNSLKAIRIAKIKE